MLAIKAVSVLCPCLYALNLLTYFRRALEPILTGYSIHHNKMQFDILYIIYINKVIIINIINEWLR